MAEEHKQVKQSIDVVQLSQAMEAFNAATEKLQSSYELLQDEARKLREEIEDKNRKLSDISNLLETVLNNTRSAILVVSGGGIVIKNRAGDRLINDIGEEYINAMLQSSPHEGVFDYDNGNGRYFRLSVGGLVSENISGSVFVIDEITTLKEFEQERYRGEKLQLMGEMAANIAHEIRNPLGSMELYASLLERDLGDLDQKRLTHNIIKGVRTINGIISNTLLFAKELKISSDKYVLSDIVDDVVLYLQHIVRDKRVSIVNKLDEEHTIRCDRDLFRQVVMNLVHNAIDAVKADHGVVTIESLLAGDYICLLVKDNGSGMADDVKGRLFMPFQTTKAKGTGLGLSIAYKIVKAHGGDITADNPCPECNETVFTVKMPMLDTATNC